MVELSGRVSGASVQQLQDMQRVDQTQRGTVGQIGGHRVEVGEGAREPSRASRALNAIGNFFKSIGEGIKGAFTSIANKIETYQAQRAEAARIREVAPNRQPLLDALPHGVTISPQGVIGGQHVVTGFPNHPSQGVNAGKSLETWLNQMGTTQITPKTDPKTQQLKPLQQIAGIDVGSQCVKDLYRLDIHIDDGQGHVYHAKQDPAVDGARNTNVVTNMRAFTGSDNATTVLTGLINQQFSQLMTDTWSHQDGSLAVGQPDQGKTGPVKYRDPSGTESMIQPSGIGSAPINITKTPNGDFQVEISFEQYYSHSGRGFDKHDLPGMDGGVYKGTGHLVFIVDANEAAQGRVSVTVPQPLTVDFEGRMA